MIQNKQNWKPLESNPEVINPYVQKMGLKTDEYCFHQMLSTDQWAQSIIPQPVLGVLFLYQLTPVQVDYKKQQAPTLNPEFLPKDIFFMKQYAYNACGTIGLFHIIINAMKKYPNIVTQGSYLHNFVNQGEQKSAQDRGKLLKQSKNIQEEHVQASSEGQSQCKQEVKSHFISFIVQEGRLYEMDGFKKCPVDHGQCTEEEILEKSCGVIRKFMSRDPENISFSMMVLAKNQSSDQQDNSGTL